VTNHIDQNSSMGSGSPPDGRAALSVATRVAACLGQVEGIAAVALGGSWARGVAGIGSDIDLGIYYQPSNAPSIEQLRYLAYKLHTGESSAQVTGFGEWGPWVNGGAWLKIQEFKVDWLYRDFERVSRVIEDCSRGVVSCDYYLGHPHGFHNHIYLAEISYGRPLLDRFGILDRLKTRVSAYPASMKNALVTKFLYGAGFMLDLARPTVARGDVFHVSGCLFRCAAAIIQVLFALNETYFLNEKGAMNVTDSFKVKPPAFSSRVRKILATPGDKPDSLQKAVAEMNSLIAETRSLSKAVIS
jgi:predicted nucleotidyltransferase